MSDVADDITVMLSPDSSHVVVSGLDGARNTRDLWTVDIKRGLRTRFTFDAADEMSPVWSPDGRDFFSRLAGGAYSISSRSRRAAPARGRSC